MRTLSPADTAALKAAFNPNTATVTVVATNPKVASILAVKAAAKASQGGQGAILSSPSV